MPTDKNDDRISEAAAKRGSDAPEHYYEPEAHHEWFPSEQFFFSWLAVGSLGFFCLCLALIAHHIIDPGYHAGELADHEIKANHAVAWEDETATKNARDRARAEVMPVYKPGEGIDPSQRLRTDLSEIAEMQHAGLVPLPELSAPEHSQLLNLSFQQFQKFAANDLKDASLAVAKLRAKVATMPKPQASKLMETVENQRNALKHYLQLHPDVTDVQESVAISLPPNQVPTYNASLINACNRLFRIFSRLPIDDDNLLLETAIEFLPDNWDAALRRSSAIMIASAMTGTVGVDREATQAKAEKAAALVKPVMRQINVGDLIVEKSKPITEETISKLEAMGITQANRWPIIGGLLVSVAAAVSLVALFLYTYEAKLLFSTRSLGLMYTLSVMTVLAATLLGKSSPQVVPIPAAALLLAIFFGQRAAVAVTFPLLIFAAVDHLIDFNNLIALGTGAGVAIATYSKRRHALMSTGMLIGVAQAFGFLVALAITQPNLTATALGASIGLEFAGGIASSVIAVGILPFLENIFGLITPFRLAELTDADQPLLRRLEENAPGTYQHSLAVANLAEAGARAIGADVNLVRAGAYYHDVGKMVRPKYFIENQLGATNPHDSMTPEASRERVLAHVTDGLVLAKQYSLPKAVQDFIPMHQGTSLMAYFYHKACMRDGVDAVDPLSYRYPGPKPQSKETSIVMLADVSEAVTHSMKDPTEEEVDIAITKVFQNRWDDGQFNESGLSYSELQRVKKAFVRVWRTLHHDRLKYPSTTTGRMPVPPSDLPTAATLSNVVAGNEFAVESQNKVEPAPAQDAMSSSSPTGPVNETQGNTSNGVQPHDANQQDTQGNSQESANHAAQQAVQQTSEQTTPETNQNHNGKRNTSSTDALEELLMKEAADRDEGCC